MEQAKVKMVKFAPLTLGKDVIDEKTQEKDRPTVRWSMRGNYPRATVFTSSNLQDKEGKFDYNKMIIAPFDILTIQLFINQVKELLDKKEKSSYKEINCLNTKFKDGERTNEKFVQATVRVGIDKDGVAYLVVMAEGKPKIKFDILPPEWFEFKDDNGDIITHPSKLSREYAKVYIRTLELLLESEVENYKTVEMIDGPKRKGNMKNTYKPKPKQDENKEKDNATSEDVNDVLDSII